MTNFYDVTITSKKRKYRPIQKLYNPRNGQNETRGNNNIGQ